MDVTGLYTVYVPIWSRTIFPLSPSDPVTFLALVVYGTGDPNFTGCASQGFFSSVFLPGSCWNSSPLALGASTLTRWKFFTTGLLRNFAPACRLCKKCGRPTAKTQRTLIWTNSTILGQSKASSIILCVFLGVSSSLWVIKG